MNQEQNKWDAINQRKRMEIQIAQAVNLANAALLKIREASPLAGEIERKQLDKLFEFYFAYLQEKTELKLAEFDARQRIGKDNYKRALDNEHTEQANGAYENDEWAK